MNKPLYNMLINNISKCVKNAINEQIIDFLGQKFLMCLNNMVNTQNQNLDDSSEMLKDAILDVDDPYWWIYKKAYDDELDEQDIRYDVDKLYAVLYPSKKEALSVLRLNGKETIYKCSDEASFLARQLMKGKVIRLVNDLIQSYETIVYFDEISLKFIWKELS